MHTRSNSEISDVVSSSSLEFSYSDMESMDSQFDMVDKPIPNERLAVAPPTFVSDLPPVNDDPLVPWIPQDLAKDEPKPAPTPIVHKDPLFYYENVVLKVEDTLFCVPKSGLNEPGTYFNKLFAGPWYGSERPGSSDDNPIVLEGVSKDHFQAFLKLIFPSRRGPRPYPDHEAQWLAMLHLGAEWNFPDVSLPPPL
ncbi:hypothetical protein BJ165DRAFT_1000570 [Panaeolus papilionaceus]|nr:hypothetical protein BJ165DRAFT_1000570 [Panaeolus papilionaceus]